MCAAEFFRQRRNFLVDLAENIFQELATMIVGKLSDKKKTTRTP
jgi:hypothetical protein